MKKVKYAAVAAAIVALIVGGGFAFREYRALSAVPSLSSVDGWHQDRAQARQLGINAQVPDGKSFDEADAVVYAMNVSKAKFPQITSVEGLINADRQAIYASGAKAQVLPQPSLKTADGVALRSSAYFPGRRGGWDRVTYAEQKKAYVVIALSAKTQAAFEKAMPDYEKFVAGFRLGR